MSTRTTTIVVLLMIVGATLAGLLLWNHLPDLMASHWGPNDQVNGHVTKFWGVFLMPLITLGMLGLFLVIPSIDPLKANIAQFRDVFNLFITLIVAFMLYIYALSLLWNLGYTDFGMSKSDKVWDETHRLGSVLFMISGALAFMGSFFGGMLAFWFLFVPLIGSTLITLVYSYLLYQREVKA